RDEQAADIVAALENPSAIADQCYAGFLYGSHPYGHPLEGVSATVPKLGRGDVTDFYERWYRPNDTILVLVGDVVAAEATVRLREAFGAWRPRADAVAVRAAPPGRLPSRHVHQDADHDRDARPGALGRGRVPEPRARARAPRQGEDLSPRAIPTPHREPRRARRAPRGGRVQRARPRGARDLPRAG